MIQDIISVYSIFCDLKEVANIAKIISSRKLPDIRYYFYYKHLYYLCNIPDNDLSFPSGGNQSVGGSEHGGSKSGAVHVPTGRKQSGCAHGKIRQWYRLIN